MAAPLGVESFFSLHEDSIKLCTNANTLFQSLYRRGLLSNEDRAVVGQESTDSGKIKLICGILCENPSSPWVVLDILIHDGVTVGEGRDVLREMLETYLHLHFPDQIPSYFEGNQLVGNSSHEPYFKLIQFLETILLQQGTTSVEVGDRMQGLLDENLVGYSIPSEVKTSFLELFRFLRKEGLCHEVDTDIFCKVLLDVAPTNSSFHQLLKSFSDCRSSSYLLYYNMMGVCPTLETSYAVMYKGDIPDLTLDDIFFLKDFLAHHLRIKRHCFCLREVKDQGQHSYLSWTILAPLEKKCEHFLQQKSQIDEELCQIFERSLSTLSVSSFEIYLRQEGKYSVVLRYPRVSLQRSPHCVSKTEEPIMPANFRVSQQRSRCVSMGSLQRSPHHVSMMEEPVMPGNPRVSQQRSPHHISMMGEPVMPGNPRVSQQRSPHHISMMGEPVMMPGNHRVSQQKSPHHISMMEEPVMPGNPRVSQQRSPHHISMMEEPVMMPGNHRVSQKKSPRHVSVMEEPVMPGNLRVESHVIGEQARFTQVQ